MKTLVTGASGNFAAYLIRELTKEGHDVTLFSRKKPGDEFSNLPWIQGDILDVNDCLSALKGGFDAVHHTAAKPGPTDTPGSASNEDPALFPKTMETNIIGTYHLLQSCVRNDVGIFVMTGSNCSLGHGFRISKRPFELKYLPIDEDHPSDPEDSYSFSKLTGEHLLKMYANVYGLRTYSLRSAGITNEAGRKRMAANAKPTGGWSEWLFPWIASEDLARAHRLLMEQAASIEPNGVYFCNNDDTTCLEPTMEILEKFRPELVPLAHGITGNDTLMSNARLKKAVGWKPVESWRQYL